MISIIAFILVTFGCLNWLSIGFFQYDIVAGLFGYQGSIFSRIVYIIVGIASIYLVFVIIKNKGRLTVKKLKKEEQPMVDKITKKDKETIEKDEEIARQVKENSENHVEEHKNQDEDNKIEHIDTEPEKNSETKSHTQSYFEKQSEMNDRE